MLIACVFNVLHSANDSISYWLVHGFHGILVLFYCPQANSNAREGRVMIFNLVEAAQEFLSEIVPVGQLGKLVCLLP